MDDRNALAGNNRKWPNAAVPYVITAGVGNQERNAIDQAMAKTGAATLRFTESGVAWSTARARGEDRPWSRAPKARPAPQKREEKPEETAEE